ncbi:MAG: NAD(P)H-dependent oxidoreductase [Methanoregulaceae archaeon]|jgi:NAD(P)H dehydrogenase (quinone)|nr:NAD(P)H-dependent oxidoreductase [Methanoregulaceae archaeon]
MNILYIYAHPEPRSFNGALKEMAMVTLGKKGHTVKVSNLYAIKWKAVLDTQDFRMRQNLYQFNPAMEQIHGVETGSLAPDIQEEIAKVGWADLLIFQFPIWWSSMPAILKGWFDRVFVQGFVVDLEKGNLYREGLLKGKKAMIVATTGATQEMYSPQGIHGDLEDHLSTITHNIFEFVGMSALPSFIVFGAASMTRDEGTVQLGRYKTMLEKL